MSKRIVYHKYVYERVASGSSSTARVASIAESVLELAKTMEQDSLHPTRDNIMEVLNLVKEHLFQRHR
jgi:hypothetical protein